MPQIVLQLNAPVATMERFAEMTGIPLDTVKYRVHKGVYPILPRKTTQERPQINLVAFYSVCASHAHNSEQFE
jgi:hypothetical protein